MSNLEQIWNIDCWSFLRRTIDDTLTRTIELELEHTGPEDQIEKKTLKFCFSQVVGFDVRIPNMQILKSGHAVLKS